MELEEAIRRAIDWARKDPAEEHAPSVGALLEHAAEPLIFDGSALVAPGTRDGTRVVASLSPARRRLEIFVGTRETFNKMKVYLPRKVVAQLWGSGAPPVS
jgi:hypothetical protein